MSFLKDIHTLLKFCKIFGILPFFSIEKVYNSHCYEYKLTNKKLILSYGIILFIILNSIYFLYDVTVNRINYNVIATKGDTEAINQTIETAFAIITYSLIILMQIEQVDRFLTKNINQEMSFTAYGFFTVDNSTIFTFFSAITTYLVILIQFNQLE
ncbi:gustatory receptor 68a-like [Condylostylus longicornis]|uniref:gustatory receptor 68a-like n=1 Tax=Condylostylus longicornis TaxID=2530218 RepID=UPI00244DA9F9|nr:gustatory receptor 68a-like [Condylostylus longicornis]